jgi:transmembrane sensor
MSVPLSSPRKLDAVERQAMSWMRMAASGRMTHADGDALRRWCQADPSHAAAFAQARQRWDALGEAGAAAAVHQPAQAVEQVRRGVRVDQRRRLFLGGALGAMTAAGVAAMVRPPLGLWPSWDALQADYRTAAGERRTVALPAGVSVELNTRTSLAVLDDGQLLSLIEGETAIDMPAQAQALSVVAGAARSTGAAARFEVRRQGEGACVRCLHGRVRVEHAAGVRELGPRQQLVYTGEGLGDLTALADPEGSAWREGFLRFSGEPLGEVIAEINRYRSGRVVLWDDSVAARPVTGRFRIDALDVAITQIRQSFNLRARSLPGGVLLLA